MEDRELLELAARAAGYDTSHPWNAERLLLNPPVDALCIDGVSTAWNPLTDDSDALRLAVNLNLAIKPLPMRVPPAIECWQNKDLMQTWAQAGYVLEEYESCPHAATRRAIVRAAAEIGEAA